MTFKNPNDRTLLIMNIKKAVTDYPIQHALADPNATPFSPGDESLALTLTQN
jgi:hypothetical protein